MRVVPASIRFLSRIAKMRWPRIFVNHREASSRANFRTLPDGNLRTLPNSEVRTLS